MIVVDTSALFAIVFDELEAPYCAEVIEASDHLVISAGTLVESLVVSHRRSVRREVERLIDALNFEIVPVTAVEARRVARAYGRWEKGLHPAGLNLGDCFAYAVAQERDCPLLYVGNDFTRTDLRRASAGT